MKRIVPVLLVLAMLLLFPAALANETDIISSGTCGENLTWTLDSAGVLTISGTGAMTDYETLFIEEEGYWIPDVPWYSIRDKIKKVIVAEGVTTIGSFAFCDCSSLREVKLPETVARLGNCVFRSNISLTNLDLPNGIYSIGGDCFLECSALTTIKLPESLNNLGGFAFTGCTGLEEAVVNCELKNLTWNIFNGCTNLKKVTLGTSVKNIEEDCFKDCNALEEVFYCGTENRWNTVNIQSGNEPLLKAHMNFQPVSLIGKCGEKCFWELSEDGVLTIIGKGSTYDYTMDDKYGPWADLVYAGYKIRAVKVEEGITGVGDCLFRQLTDVTELSLPSSITTIGYAAFQNCTALEKLVLSTGEGFISNGAFEGCSSLRAVDLGTYHLTMGGRIFQDCTSLTSIKFPEGVTLISRETFSGCTSLNEVEVPSTVTAIDYSAFASCPLKKVVYGGTEEMWNRVAIDVSDSGNDSLKNAAYQWGSLSNTCGNVGGNIVWQFKPESGTLSLTGKGATASYAVAQTAMDGIVQPNIPWWKIRDSIKAISIGEGITRLSGSNIFSNLTNLESITLPVTLQQIDDYSFYNSDSISVIYYSGTPAQWETLKSGIGAGNDPLLAATVHFRSAVGDINGDSTVDEMDASLARQAAVGLIDLTEQQQIAADVNEDGTVNVLDANLIRLFAAGLIPAL